MMQPDPYRPIPLTPVSNPYSRARYMDHTTTYDDVDVEQQVSPHEANDVDDNSDSQDIPQPDDPAQLVLRVDEFHTIGMYICKQVLFIRIYLYMLLTI
jgi:hypothetical protein